MIIGATFHGSDTCSVVSEKYHSDSSVFEFLPGIIIATTFDRGKTWSKTVIDDSSVIANAAIFADVNHIWLIGPTILYSSDAGIKWQNEGLQDDFGMLLPTCLYFRDSAVGFAGQKGLAISRTVDGGRSWRRVHNTETNSGNYDIHQISFSTQQFGLAVGGDFRTYILRTTDGGINWLKDSGYIGSQISNTLKGLSFPDPKHAFVSMEFGDFYSSIDSGTTWSLVGDHNPLNGVMESISFLDSVYGIATVNAEMPIIGYSANGGVTWHKFTLSGNNAGTFFYSYFADIQLAYAIFGDKIITFNPSQLLVPITSHSNGDPIITLEANTLYIDFSNKTPASIQVYDVLGRIIKQFTVHEGEKAILSLQELPHQILIRYSWQNNYNSLKFFH